MRSYIPLKALITTPVYAFQSIVSLEKKNKAKHAKLMRAVRDQLEKLVHIWSHLVSLSIHSGAYLYLTAVDTCRDAGTSTERTVCGDHEYPHDAYMPDFNWDSGLACRENGAQEYAAGYAQDLDEIRALWMAMAQRREALTVRDAYAMFALTVHDPLLNLAWSTDTTTSVSRTAAN